MNKKLLFVFLSTVFLGNQGTSQDASQSRLYLNKKPEVSAMVPTPLSVWMTVDNKPDKTARNRTLGEYYRQLIYGQPKLKFVESTEAELPSVTVESVNEKITVQDAVALDADEKLYSSESIMVSTVFPNPVTDFASFEYSLGNIPQTAKILLFNILGSKVGEYPLKKNSKNILRIDTRVMHDGLFFYQLTLDGKKVATKKMLVKHRQ